MPNTINSLEFKSQLTGELDKAIVMPSVAAMFLDNAFRTKFVGTKDVIIPDVNFVGLADYDREDGFARGGVTVQHSTYTLTQDRGRSFSIDREDMDETGIAGLAGQVMGEFVRTEVAPEIDAYTFSKLAKIATDNQNIVSTETFGANKSFKLVSDAINKVQGEIGFDTELVALVNSEVWADLMATSEISRSLEIGDFAKGEINTKVKKLNGTAIIPVPAARMKTVYEFATNEASTSEGGFTVGEGAKEIGLLILPKRAAKLIKKTEKVRVFNPDINQEKDAYKFDYRIYYDALVKASDKKSIWTYTYSK